MILACILHLEMELVDSQREWIISEKSVHISCARLRRWTLYGAILAEYPFPPSNHSRRLSSDSHEFLAATVASMTHPRNICTGCLQSSLQSNPTLNPPGSFIRESGNRAQPIWTGMFGLGIPPELSPSYMQ